MARPKRWHESSIKSGYGVVKLRSWRYFFDFVHQEMLDYETYIWRGHRNDDWLLESTLDRLVKQAKVAKTREFGFRNEHLERFKFAVRGRRGTHPLSLKNDEDWWALGQHYGLATPLLDWTFSPFVAAYFAFYDQGQDQKKNRAIYALHKPSVETKVKSSMQEKLKYRQELKKKNAEGKVALGKLSKMVLERPLLPDVSFIRPMSDENQRLVNQGGIFTKAPDKIDLKTWVQEEFPTEEKGYVLMKILIPNADRVSCLKGLNRMNINHMTLFPDLYGSSKYCNHASEIKKYC